jgi:hypothetical protein
MPRAEVQRLPPEAIHPNAWKLDSAKFGAPPANFAVKCATHKLTAAVGNRAAYTQGLTWERGASPVNFR